MEEQVSTPASPPRHQSHHRHRGFDRSSNPEGFIAETWIGFRPGTPDGLPVIGKGSAEGVIVAGGLFRNGILLGPLVGEIAAALAMGETPAYDLKAFDPARF
jgi:glycine/D-amino acid oxidase-like deaminating enzyme